MLYFLCIIIYVLINPDIIYAYIPASDVSLTTHGAANFLRTELATALRSSGAFQVNVLLGGVDQHGPALYYCDYLGEHFASVAAVTRWQGREGGMSREEGQGKWKDKWKYMKWLIPAVNYACCMLMLCSPSRAGCLHKVPFGAHGYASNFTLSYVSSFFLFVLLLTSAVCCFFFVHS